MLGDKFWERIPIKPGGGSRDRESRRKDKLAFLSEEEETANARAMNWEDLGERG